MPAKWDSSAANSKFRSAFIDELYLLEQAEIDVHKILDQSAFEKHERAKIEFEIMLTEKERKSFVNDWSKYKKYVLCFWGQKMAPGSIDVREKESRKSRSLIVSILEHTKYK